MKWYYAAAGNQVGPIDETELNRLVTQGTVRADTLVWHDGLARGVRSSEGAVHDGAAQDRTVFD